MNNDMDIKLPKKPWYVKYRLHLLGGAVLLALIGYATSLQLRPKTLRTSIDADQIALVCDGDFLEYVDVNGLVCPVVAGEVRGVPGIGQRGRHRRAHLLSERRPAAPRRHHPGALQPEGAGRDCLRKAQL